MTEMFDKHQCCTPVIIVIESGPGGEGDQKPLTEKEFKTTMSKVSEALDRIDAKIVALTESEASEDANAVAAQAKIVELQAEIDRLNQLPTLTEEEQARLDGLEAKLDEIKAGAEAAPSPDPAPEG